MSKRRRRAVLCSPAATTPAVTAVMRANKKRNTRPELIVRRLLHSLGYRYRLHDPTLPGTPDVVFRSRRKALFIHGCFWHQHSHQHCPLRKRPKSNLNYWRPKLRRNVSRDWKHVKEFIELGWDTLVIWECELRQPRQLTTKLLRFLS